MLKEKIYLPNLNGLRFIAALMVVIHHLEQFLAIFGFKNYWNNKVIISFGDLGVKLFFVLSGFLITYLLLVEEKSTKTISIRKFYIRRVLRIWPLYYLILVLSFFVLVHFDFLRIPGFTERLNSHFTISLLLYVLFLPNALMFSYGVVVPFASQAWSVGVEEQFYLIWPVIMKFFKRKINVFVVVLIVYLFLKFVGFDYIKHNIYWTKDLEKVKNFWEGFSIDCMAIGGLFAYILFVRDKLMKIIVNNTIFYISLFLTILSIAFHWDFGWFSAEIYSILFGLIISNLAFNYSLRSWLEHRPLNYLGKISYGLYMYHPLAIVIAIKIGEKLDIIDNHFLIFCIAFVFTTMIATVSYEIIEKKFIRLKLKYSQVISGDNAKKK